MIRLYTHPFAIVPWRIRIALREKGIEYEPVPTDLYTKSATPQFRKLNPFAQIPVIDDDGFVIAESIAILEYLEEKYPAPALLPRDVRLRATARQFMCWGTDYWPGAWKKWMAPRLPDGLGDAYTEQTVAEGKQEICSHLDVLETRLSGRTWLADEYSLADICYAPFVLVLDRVDLGNEISNRPEISRWHRQLLDQPSIAATMMPPNPS